MEINKVYSEDCLITMGRMRDSFCDTIITSPPYDGLRKYNGFAFDFARTAQELFRVLKQGGIMVWIVGDQTVSGSETGTSFKQALYFNKIGFKLYDTMIYRKQNYAPKSHRRYEQSFEYMFILSKGTPKTFNPIMVPCAIAGTSVNWGRKGSNIKEGVFRRRDEVITVNETKIKENVWTYTCGATQTGHPAPFPKQLAADHITSWTNEGDLIYDPFGGSGTTGEMAHILNRDWILSEISSVYAFSSAKRIETLKLQPTLF